MTGKIRVLCVDDDESTNRLHAILLGMEEDMEVVGLLREATEVLPGIVSLRPDVVLLDFRLRTTTAHALVAEIAIAHPGVRVVVVSGFDRPETVDELIAAGAAGFVTKGADASTIAPAVRAAARGERPVVGGGLR